SHWSRGTLRRRSNMSSSATAGCTAVSETAASDRAAAGMMRNLRMWNSPGFVVGLPMPTPWRRRADAPLTGPVSKLSGTSPESGAMEKAFDFRKFVLGGALIAATLAAALAPARADDDDHELA